MSKKPYLTLLLIFLLIFLLFYPSLFTFFTHDDFFLLKISNIHSLKEFFTFFSLFKSPEGLGMYRPLSMQSFYFLAWKVFKLNPLGLHIISFLTFFILVYLVYDLSYILSGKIATSLITTFVYAVSSSHFAHLYFLGVYQELSMSVFFLLALIFSVRFWRQKRKRLYLLSFLFFILSLLSKETATVLPLVLVIVYFYLGRLKKNSLLSLKHFLLSLFPFILILSLYFYMRFSYYGFPKGDSYVWQISPRILNTLFWYFLWSFNIPEFVIDFVGPGLKINLVPLIYWRWYLIPILFLVLLCFSFLAIALSKSVKIRKIRMGIMFCLLWFLTTLLPVVFLPLHKFAYYLTLPLFSVAFGVSVLMSTLRNKRFLTLFLILWFLASIISIKITYRTHWVVNGAITSKRVYDYLHLNNITKGDLIFYDLPEDLNLGWVPSESLKDALSDTDFFGVFFPGIRVQYLDKVPNNVKSGIKLRARGFLNF